MTKRTYKALFGKIAKRTIAASMLLGPDMHRGIYTHRGNPYAAKAGQPLAIKQTEKRNKIAAVLRQQRAAGMFNKKKK